MDGVSKIREEELTPLVEEFYARVRADPALGPIFNDAIDDWPEHLGKLTAFWSSVMLTSGRRLFVREHCRAVAIALPGLSRAELLSLEANVLAAAPADAKRWNDARVLSAAEPIDQLNAFLATIEWPPEKHLAVNRQAERWQSLAR